MGTRFFSTKDRPFHLGPYPLERLRRVASAPDWNAVPPMPALDFRRLDTPHSLVNAMGEYQAMMDVLRDGLVNPEPGDAPVDPAERSIPVNVFLRRATDQVDLEVYPRLPGVTSFSKRLTFLHERRCPNLDSS